MALHHRQASLKLEHAQRPLADEPHLLDGGVQFLPPRLDAALAHGSESAPLRASNAQGVTQIVQKTHACILAWDSY